VKVEQVDIARLRGIPGGWPTLLIGDKGLVVYGPNGVGKSSIIDALEATITGRSTLFSNERLGVNWDAAVQHVKGGPPTVTIRGKLNGKPLHITLGETPVDDLTDWIAEAKSASFVLRRYMLLRFIDAQPRERYDQIEPFLNLEDFTNFETGVKELARSLETRFVAASTEAAAKAQVIRQTFSLDREHKLERVALIALLSDRLRSAGIPIGETDLSKLAAILRDELGGEASSQKLASLGAAKHQAQQLTSVSLLLPLYNQVVAATDELLRELGTSAQKVPLKLLVDALDHFTATNGDICPVCEQAVNHASLMTRLTERIKEDHAVRTATNTLETRLGELTCASAMTRQAYANFVKGWEQLGFDPLPSCYAAAANVFTRLEALTVQTAGENADQIRAAFLDAECDPLVQISQIDDAIVAVGGGERRNQLVEAASFVTCLLNDVTTHETREQFALVLGRQKRAADKLHAHAEAARKSAVQKIADRVATLANVFYEAIHPDESIATSKLTVRQATSASMQISTTFYGREAQPLLYYSESHLDTLGLCYFLAIRKLEVAASPKFKLLLVDDVLHSVDAEHRVRLARLLKENFSDHQLVLVTHDKFFYERLKAILGGGYRYLAISAWDIELGPRLSDPSTDLDRVIDPSTRVCMPHADLASAGGRFFEWLLKSLTERLQVQIPARFSREHDIGSMWPNLAKKMTRHRGFAARHPNLIDELNSYGWVRNKIGAHENEEDSPITEKEVTAFVDQLAILYHATNCKDCGAMIQKSQTDAWRCECSKIQYDP
jgi:hypothetical protein